MYLPEHFEVTSRDEIFEFVEANSFGQLISSVEGRPFATHMPFIVSEDRKRLLGHVAKQNPHHCKMDGVEVLVTFQGPHDYISPSWYSSPGVPTWNYQAVHIYGVCRVFTDADRIRKVVDSLTHKYESAFKEPYEPEYNASMLDFIVGIEIAISEIQCKYKLSQNRSKQDQQRVTEQLEKRGSHKLAEAMNTAHERQQIADSHNNRLIQTGKTGTE